MTVTDADQALRAAQAGMPEAEEPSDGDLQRCGSLFDEATDFTTITGNQNTIELEGADLMAVKISGNMNAVNIAIEAVGEEETEEEAEGFEGLCLILSGNMARARVSIANFPLGTFALVASGNEPAVVVDVGAEGEVEGFDVDISGNAGTLTVQGNGTFTCPEGQLSGNMTSVNCS